MEEHEGKNSVTDIIRIIFDNIMKEDRRLSQNGVEIAGTNNYTFCRAHIVTMCGHEGHIE